MAGDEVDGCEEEGDGESQAGDVAELSPHQQGRGGIIDDQGNSEFSSDRSDLTDRDTASFGFGSVSA